MGRGQRETERPPGPQGVDQGTRGTLAVLGHQGVLAGWAQFNAIRAAIPGGFSVLKYKDVLLK